MAEPIVGMNYGSYQSATASIKFDARYNQELYNGLDNCTYKVTTQEQNVAMGGKNRAHLAVDINDKKHAVAYAQTNAGTLQELFYKGETKNYTTGYDIQFDLITGKKTYAVDLNKNGIVDKNEVFNHGEGPKPNCNFLL